MRSLSIIFVVIASSLVSCSEDAPETNTKQLLLGEWQKTSEFRDNAELIEFQAINLQFEPDRLRVDNDSIVFFLGWEVISNRNGESIRLYNQSGVLTKKIISINSKEVYLKIADDCNCVEKFLKQD